MSNDIPPPPPEHKPNPHEKDFQVLKEACEKWQEEFRDGLFPEEQDLRNEYEIVPGFEFSSSFDRPNDITYTVWLQYYGASFKIGAIPRDWLIFAKQDLETILEERISPRIKIVRYAVEHGVIRWGDEK